MFRECLEVTVVVLEWVGSATDSTMRTSCGGLNDENFSWWFKPHETFRWWKLVRTDLSWRKRGLRWDQAACKGRAPQSRSSPPGNCQSASGLLLVPILDFLKYQHSKISRGDIDCKEEDDRSTTRNSSQPRQNSSALQQPTRFRFWETWFQPKTYKV